MNYDKIDNKVIEIVFVAGAHGSLGSAIIEILSAKENCFCIGLQRNIIGTPSQYDTEGIPHTLMVPCDVSNFPETATLIRHFIDPDSLQQSFNDVSNGSFSRTLAGKTFRIGKITLVHAVGPFKYEGYLTKDLDREIDPLILQMNYEAFENMAESIFSNNIHGQSTPLHINLCTFGSVSEPYDIPLWFSFNEAKKKALHYMQSQVEKHREHNNPKVSGLYIRTSTINTDKENNLRPNAPEEIKKYWLEPKIVAAKFCEDLGNLEAGECIIDDLIKPAPNFDPLKYYQPENLDLCWRSMMP